VVIGENWQGYEDLKKTPELQRINLDEHDTVEGKNGWLRAPGELH